MRNLNIILFMLLTFFGFEIFAQVTNPDTDFFTQVVALIQAFGGLPWMAKISAISLIIVAATKTSFLAPLWQKLPALAQTLFAPFIGLIGGILALGAGLTWQSAVAYVTAGAGAILMHEILDGIKGIPGLGSLYVTIITLFEAMLGGSSAKQ